MFEHGVIIFADISEDTVYVNLNETIQIFCVLVSYPALPAIDAAWLIMRNTLNGCVISGLMYYKMGNGRREKRLM